MRYGKIAFLLMGALMGFARMDAAVIIDQNHSDYTIYTGKTATAAEKNAAAELHKYLQAATGVDLPITQTYTGKKQILVGSSPEAAALLPGIDFRQWRPDEILIAPSGDNLVLAGALPRGTLYAVYTFLEDRLGIRFWTAEEENIPQVKQLALPDSMLRYAPKIPIRALSCKTLMQNPAFAVKSKIQGAMIQIPAEWGSSTELIGPWHTFDRFLPAAEYFKSHPEYFSWRDGKRVGGQTTGQLCLNNPELRQEFLKQVLAELRKHSNPEFISVTQNDNMNYCQCDRCRKVDAAGGGPSASMIRFVNYIAENIEKEFPHVMVQTFAYQYSRHAPTDVKPRHNVSIFLCTIEQDLSHPLNDPRNKDNAAIMKDLRNWSKISSQIDIWDYVTSFSSLLLPVPNLSSVPENIKTFASAKAHMVMMQGDVFNPGVAGDLQPLKVWVWSKLLWHPEADPAKLEQEFVTGYYGAAAPKVMEYLILRRQAIKRDTAPVNCFTYSAPWLDGKTLLAGMATLAEAKRLAENNPVLLKRIGTLSKSVEYVLLEQYNSLQGFPGGPSKEQARQIAAEWLAYIDENKITNWAEEWSTENSIRGIRDSLKMMANGKALGYQLPPFFAKLKKTDYFIVDESAFAIHGGAKVAEVVDDPLAANGVALALHHLEYGWSPKLYFRSPMSTKEDYDIYAAVRLERPAHGGVCEFSGWDGKDIYMTKHIEAGEVKSDAYSYILVGSGKLRDTGYFFFGAKVNPEIQRTLIDHLVFVRKKTAASR